MLWACLGISPANAQNANESSSSKTIDSFPSYSTSMTSHSCKSLYNEIMSALSSSGQALASNAIDWALDYEQASSKGKSCPPLPKSSKSPVSTPKPANDKMTAFASLESACSQDNKLNACIEVYQTLRGEDPYGFVYAEHICETWSRPQYCFEAGADLLLGNGQTYPDEYRAYDNFHSGCYKRHAESCYQGGMLKMAWGGFYDAMLLFDVACTNFGYKDSCALKRAAQRGGDKAIAEANKKLRENHDDALHCKKTRIIGNGGRSHISYDCRTNLQWRLGKKR